KGGSTMIIVASNIVGGCGLLCAVACILALVARADRGFHSPRPIDLQPYPLRVPVELLRVHAQAANLCDACRSAPWDQRTRGDGYLCSPCARRLDEKTACLAALPSRE